MRNGLMRKGLDRTGHTTRTAVVSMVSECTCRQKILQILRWWYVKFEMAQNNNTKRTSYTIFIGRFYFGQYHFRCEWLKNDHSKYHYMTCVGDCPNRISIDTNLCTTRIHPHISLSPRPLRPNQRHKYIVPHRAKRDSRTSCWFPISGLALLGHRNAKGGWPPCPCIAARELFSE